MADLTYFRTKYKEFSDIDDSEVQFYLDDCLNEFDVARWDAWFDKGHSALTAHQLSLSIKNNKTEAGEAGANYPVTAKKVGDVQVNFGLSVVSESYENGLTTTPYGQEYLRLSSMVGIGAVAIP